MTASPTPRREPRPADGWVTPSPLAPAVFDVPRSARADVCAWLEQAGAPHAWSRDPGSPAVDAWALCDGGVIAVSQVAEPGAAQTPSGPLTPGLRVVGRAALCLLAAELGLTLPADVRCGQGRHALRNGAGTDRRDRPEGLADRREEIEGHRPDGGERLREQAELLAECTDARTLRWVATTLVAEDARAVADGPDRPGGGDPGPGPTGRAARAASG